MTECPTRFSLAQWKTEDLSEDEMHTIGRHVDGCDRCTRSLDEIGRNATEYDRGAAENLSEIMDRINTQQPEGNTSVLTRRPPSPFFRIAAPVMGALAAAAVIALVVVAPWKTVEPEPPHATYKGSVSLEVIAKRGHKQFRVESGHRLRENDALRFVVTTGASGYASVISTDSNGVVSSFYPDSDPSVAVEPLRIPGAGRHELPGSIILDGSAGSETFVLLFSRSSFDRMKLHEKVRTTGAEIEGIEQIGDIFVQTLKVKK